MQDYPSKERTLNAAVIQARTKPPSFTMEFVFCKYSVGQIKLVQHSYTFRAAFVYILCSYFRRVFLARPCGFLILLRHTRLSTLSYFLRRKKYRLHGSRTLRGQMTAFRQKCAHSLPWLSCGSFSLSHERVVVWRIRS